MEPSVVHCSRLLIRSYSTKQETLCQEGYVHQSRMPLTLSGSPSFLPIASGLLIVAHLCIEDALLHSLHAHSWLLSYWQAFVFFSLGVLVSFSTSWTESNGGENTAGATTSNTLSNHSSSSNVKSRASKHMIDDSAATSKKKKKKAITTTSLTESLVPGVPNLPSHLTLAIRAVQSRRLKDKVAGSLTTIQFSMTTQELNYPFEAVMAALKAKYKAPNDPLNPSVRTVKTVRDVVSESAAEDDEDAKLAASVNAGGAGSTRPLAAKEGDPIATRRRDIIVGMKEVGLPSALAWALPESIIIEELSVLAFAQRCCICTLKTGGDVSIGCLQDTCLYFSDPRNDARTIFLQFMDLQGSSMVANALIKQLQPKDGVSFPKPPSMLAGPHMEALKGRLTELFGEGG